MLSCQSRCSINEFNIFQLNLIVNLQKSSDEFIFDHCFYDMNPISGIGNPCKLRIENCNFIFQMTPAVRVCISHTLRIYRSSELAVRHRPQNIWKQRLPAARTENVFGSAEFAESVRWSVVDVDRTEIKSIMLSFSPEFYSWDELNKVSGRVGLLIISNLVVVVVVVVVMVVVVVVAATATAVAAAFVVF